MPIPGLTDVYEFADWMKVEYPKTKWTYQINSEVGGLILVTEITPTVSNTLYRPENGQEE